MDKAPSKSEAYLSCFFFYYYSRSEMILNKELNCFTRNGTRNPTLSLGSSAICRNHLNIKMNQLQKPTNQITRILSEGLGKNEFQHLLHAFSPTSNSSCEPEDMPPSWCNTFCNRQWRCVLPASEPHLANISQAKRVLHSS